MSLPDRLLKILIDKARRRRDQAATNTAQSVSTLQNSQATLNSLHEFSDQKKQARRETIGQSNNAFSMSGQSRFAGKLDTAISMQQEQVSRDQDVVDAHRIVLTSEQRRLRAAELLQERKKNKERSRRLRHEQKQLDEMASTGPGRCSRDQ